MTALGYAIWLEADYQRGWECTRETYMMFMRDTLARLFPLF